MAHVSSPPLRPMMWREREKNCGTNRRSGNGRGASGDARKTYVCLVDAPRTETVVIDGPQHDVLSPSRLPLSPRPRRKQRKVVIDLDQWCGASEPTNNVVLISDGDEDGSSKGRRKRAREENKPFNYAALSDGAAEEDWDDVFRVESDDERSLETRDGEVEGPEVSKRARTQKEEDNLMTDLSSACDDALSMHDADGGEEDDDDEDSYPHFPDLNDHNFSANSSEKAVANGEHVGEDFDPACGLSVTMNGAEVRRNLNAAADLKADKKGQILPGLGSRQSSGCNDTAMVVNPRIKALNETANIFGPKLRFAWDPCILLERFSRWGALNCIEWWITEGGVFPAKMIYGKWQTIKKKAEKTRFRDDWIYVREAVFQSDRLNRQRSVIFLIKRLWDDYNTPANVERRKASMAGHHPRPLSVKDITKSYHKLLYEHNHNSAPPVHVGMLFAISAIYCIPFWEVHRAWNDITVRVEEYQLKQWEEDKTKMNGFISMPFVKDLGWTSGLDLPRCSALSVSSTSSMCSASSSPSPATEDSVELVFPYDDDLRRDFLFRQQLRLAKKTLRRLDKGMPTSKWAKMEAFLPRDVVIRCWEDDLRFIMSGQRSEKSRQVPMVNFHDYNTPPPFQWLDKNCETDDALHSKYGKSMSSTCACEGSCRPGLCPCLKNTEEFQYDDFGRLNIAKGVSVQECNSSCGCDPTKCRQRVIDDGCKYDLAVYRHPEKGWGVMTLNFIPKNSFIVEYIGEVITEEEAEKRGMDYDANNLSFLFDMDALPQKGEDSPSSQFTVDATHKGNLGRFLNHSCDANVGIWPLANENIFKQRILFYTQRDIAPMDELTIDYGYETTKKVLKCYCGAAKCRHYLF